MLQDMSVQNPVLAAKICEALYFFVGGGILASRRRSVQEVLTGIATPMVTTVAASVRRPKSELWTIYAQGLLMVEGVRTTNQASYVGECWCLPGFTRDRWGFTRSAAQAADELFAEYNEILRVREIDQICVAGYSFGGCAGFALAKRLFDTGRFDSVQAVSFGAPKPGDSRVNASMMGIDNWRWMNELDPVVLAPPTYTQAPALNALLGPALSLFANQNVQPGTGTVLRGDGTLYPANRPTTTGILQDISLASFLLRDRSPQAVEHSIATYSSRMDALALIVNPLPLIFVPGPPGPAEVPEVQPGQADLLRAFDAALDLLQGQRLAASESNALPNPYVSTRENGIPVVQSDGVTIAIARTRKQAQSLASALNTSWRRWNRTRVGDPAALEASIVDNFVE